MQIFHQFLSIMVQFILLLYLLKIIKLNGKLKEVPNKTFFIIKFIYNN